MTIEKTLPRNRFLQVVLSSGVAALVVAVSPALVSSSSVSGSHSAALGDNPFPYFIATYRRSREVAEAIAAAGGQALTMIPELNLALAWSEDPDFEAVLASHPNFSDVVRDEMVAWVPQRHGAIRSHVFPPVSPLSQDPRQALFLDEQWAAATCLM